MRVCQSKNVSVHSLATSMHIILDCIVYDDLRVTLLDGPGAVARSGACPLGMQAAPRSIPTSGTFFRGDLVMKKFLLPVSLFR